jgi:hypothetical protein
MPGFLGMFCRTTLPWYYLGRLDRLEFKQGVVRYSDGVVARTEDGRNIIRRGDFVLRENDDLFVPALWREQKEIIAYSKTGYQNKSWILPESWKGVARVDLYQITLKGGVQLERNVRVTGNKLNLSIGRDEAISVLPAGTPFSERSK